MGQLDILLNVHNFFLFLIVQYLTLKFILKFFKREESLWVLRTWPAKWNQKVTLKPICLAVSLLCKKENNVYFQGEHHINIWRCHKHVPPFVINKWKWSKWSKCAWNYVFSFIIQFEKQLTRPAVVPIIPFHCKDVPSV